MKLLSEYSQHQSIYSQGYRFNPEEQIFYTVKNTSEFHNPQGYEDWKVVKIDRFEYFNKRLDELGITPDENNIRIKDGDGRFFESQIFIANQYGDIEIVQYDLYRNSIMKEGTTTSAGTRWIYAAQIRLNPLYTDFTEGKYDFTDAKNTPFWHPHLIELYENQEEVEQLVITEGQFKAYKATKEGIPTVGLTSISHFRDSEFKTLHTEILDFINKCKVKKVVILWDGDCRNISTKALENGEELTKRPGNFYWFAYNIEQHIREFFPAKGKNSLDVYFATIKSDDFEGSPKGIDDLLVCSANSVDRVIDNFNNIGKLPGPYIHWINISNDKGKKDLRKYFHLTSVNTFYGAHSDLIKEKSFVFQNSTYRVEKGIPIIEIPKDLKNYVRIGVDYYKIQQQPFPKIGGKDRTTRKEEVLTQWTKETIAFDHGKDALKLIPKYEGFTNIADHINYQKIIDGYWNLYDELDHEPREGNWKHIRILLKHLFGPQYDNELILDYLSILYRFPWQKLPVLCLVSKEQNTGKSTFLFLCKLIFKNNMILINSNDLTGDFNDHWTSKLIAASEETFLEKKEAYETIKTLTTAKEITRKEKNKSARSIPCMIHFMFCSNYEDTFIKIGKEDSRLWIVKVNTIKERIKNFDAKLEEEIPAFLNFLINREIKHEQKDRLWFSPSEFRTEAFEAVVKSSQPSLVKDLRVEITDYFERFNDDELTLCTKDLIQYFNVPNRYGSFYIKQVVRELLADREETKVGRYQFKIPRYNSQGDFDLIKGIGRCLVFKREDFIEK